MTASDSWLELPPEQMRAFGYRVIDVLVRHFTTVRHKPVTCRETRAALEARLRQELPDASPPEAVLEQLEKDVLSSLMHLDHPRCFGFVPGPSNFVRVMADALSSGFNVFAGTWLEGSGPAQIEIIVLDWLKTLLSLPAEAAGILVSGGSAANLTALAVMRRVRLDDETARAVVYGSDQTHSSIERNLRILGFRPENYQQLPSSRPPATASAPAPGCRRPGCRVPPGLCHCQCGDNQHRRSRSTHRVGRVLRTDKSVATYRWRLRAAAVLSEGCREQLAGIEQADSLSLDPHKWLFQPYEIGCVFVRNGAQLKETFDTHADYLQDAAAGGGEINFCERGLQLTRGFRAPKLWMSLKVFGVKAFRSAVERGLDLATQTEQILRKRRHWEVTSPAQLGIVTFRWRPHVGSYADINAALVDALIRDGFAFVSSTQLAGSAVLRLCTINPRTTGDDIVQVIDRLEHLAQSLGDARA